MIAYEKIKEIITLIDAGLDVGITARIFHLSEKSVRKLYRKGKHLQRKSGVDEQDSTDSTSGPGTQVPPNPEHTTWETGVARGHANPIDSKNKWSSGVNRGKANPLN
jgi:hypothetical protein